MPNRMKLNALGIFFQAALPNLDRTPPHKIVGYTRSLPLDFFSNIQKILWRNFRFQDMKNFIAANSG